MEHPTIEARLAAELEAMRARRKPKKVPAVLIQPKKIKTPKKSKKHGRRKKRPLGFLTQHEYRELTAERYSGMPYTEYLQSKWWAWRRIVKIRRCGARCNRCKMKGKTLQVHHLSYKRLWNEKDKDLELLCAGCHGQEHAFDRDATEHLKSIQLQGILAV